MYFGCSKEHQNKLNTHMHKTRKCRCYACSCTLFGLDDVLWCARACLLWQIQLHFVRKKKKTCTTQNIDSMYDSGFDLFWSIHDTMPSIIVAINMILDVYFHFFQFDEFLSNKNLVINMDIVRSLFNYRIDIVRKPALCDCCFVAVFFCSPLSFKQNIKLQLNRAWIIDSDKIKHAHLKHNQQQ